MEIEVKVVILRFLFSLITMYLMAHFTDGISDIMTPPEEREQKDSARMVIDKLKDRFPLLGTEDLTSHELIVAGCLSDDTKPPTFKDVGGHDIIKKEMLLHLVIPMRHPNLFNTSTSMRPPSGVLLSGPPGTGKSMLARALATEAGCAFLLVSSSLVEQKYFGESEKIVKAIFSLATKLQPCIIFIDEIDSMLRNRSEFEQSATYSVKTQFLQEMDKIENNNLRVLVIAATNNPKTLDKALFRRLPRTYTVGRPDMDARHEILRKLTEHETPPVGLKDISWVAENTENCSGSDIKDIFKTAAALRNEAFSTLILQNNETLSSPGFITRDHWEAAVRRIRKD